MAAIPVADLYNENGVLYGLARSQISTFIMLSNEVIAPR